MQNILMVKRLIEKEQLNKAINVLNVYKKKDSKNWEVFFELGKIYFIKKQFSLAIDNFRKALKLDRNINIKLLMAKALKELNLDFRALRVFLDLRKQNLNIREEIDNEIISMFLQKEEYLTVLRYIKKYEVIAKSDLNIKDVLKNLIIKIGVLNFNGDCINAKKLSIKTLRELNYLDIKTKNILLNEIEIADNKSYLKSFPRILKIDVTQNCNLRCKMCKVHLQKIPYGKTTKTDLKILNILFKYAEFVEWQGGEPLLYKYLKDFFDIANKNGVKQSVISNGLLLNDEYIKKIVDYKIELILSIDSVDRYIYENIRAGGSFSVLLRNIEKLYRYRKEKKWNEKFKLNCVLSRWNYQNSNNFIDIINFANKYKFTDVDIYCDSSEENFELKKEYIKFFNLTRNDLIRLAGNYNINLSIQIPEFNTNNNIVNVKKSYGLNISHKYCLLPWKKINIKFDKFVSVDCTCPKIGFLSSNTKKFFINEIWNGEKIIKIRKNIIYNNIKYLNNICKTANYRFLRKG